MAVFLLAAGNKEHLDCVIGPTIIADIHMIIAAMAIHVPPTPGDVAGTAPRADVWGIRCHNVFIFFLSFKVYIHSMSLPSRDLSIFHIVQIIHNMKTPNITKDPFVSQSRL